MDIHSNSYRFDYKIMRMKCNIPNITSNITSIIYLKGTRDEKKNDKTSSASLTFKQKEKEMEMILSIKKAYLGLKEAKESNISIDINFLKQNEKDEFQMTRR